MIYDAPTKGQVVPRALPLMGGERVEILTRPRFPSLGARRLMLFDVRRALILFITCVCACVRWEDRERERNGQREEKTDVALTQ